MSHMRRIDTVLLQREFHFSGIGQRERVLTAQERREGGFFSGHHKVYELRVDIVLYGKDGVHFPQRFFCPSPQIHSTTKNETKEKKRNKEEEGKNHSNLISPSLGVERERERQAFFFSSHPQRR